MSAFNKACPECGAELPADAPKGFCPACLVRLGAGNHITAAAPPQPYTIDHPPSAIAPQPSLRTFGDYELLED